MGDLFRKVENRKAGIDNLNGWLFDKDDPKVCKEIWKRHGRALMARWKSDPGNDGYNPWLFHEIQEIKKLENLNKERIKNGKKEN